MKHFFSAHEQHVCQQIGENSTKRTKILSLSRTQFSRKILPTDKADAVKVSRKIATQHGQLILREIFTKDNTEGPNVKVFTVFTAELGRFHLSDNSCINLFKICSKVMPIS